MTESYDALAPLGSPDNTCRIQDIRPAAVAPNLNHVGRFNDNYVTGGDPQAPTPIPACAQLPDCVTRSMQRVQIESPSYPFSHSVTWRCTGVDIQPF